MTEALDIRSQGNRMALQSQGSAKPKWMQRIGWAITALMIAFLLFDSFGKLVLEHHVVEATTMIGLTFPALIRGIANGAVTMPTGTVPAAISLIASASDL